MKRLLFLLVVMALILLIVGVSDKEEEEFLFLYVEEINSHLLVGQPLSQVGTREEKMLNVNGSGEVFVLQEIKAFDELVESRGWFVSSGGIVKLTDEINVQGIAEGELVGNVVNNLARINGYNLEIIDVLDEEIVFGLGEYVVRLGLGEIWGIAFIWNQGDLVKITTDDDWEEEFSRVWDVDSVVTILTVINYGFWQLGGR